MKRKVKARCGGGQQAGRRGAFTLVELLVAISIIVVLASLTMVAMRGAQQDVLESKTRSTIAKIHEVLASKWEGYLSRPLPLKLPTVAFQADPATGQRALSGREMARLRLSAIRDLMRMEMPDRLSDLSSPPTPLRARLFEGMANQTFFDITVPLPATLRRLQEMVAAGTWSATNLNAELLYVLVANTSYQNSSALELFRPSEIGDTDSDNMLEFIDAWGKPIQWIRWPAGLDGGASPFDLDDPFVSNAAGGETSKDPLDPLSADLYYDPAFLPKVPVVNDPSKDLPVRPGAGLFPLVYSLGPDGFSGVREEFDPNSSGVRLPPGSASPEWPLGGITLPPGYLVPGGPRFYYPDPYHPRHLPVIDGHRLGSVLVPAEAADNITNFDQFGESL
jgi:prepilin-type N-terminal cleavage/methylation domain-containing protein